MYKTFSLLFSMFIINVLYGQSSSEILNAVRLKIKESIGIEASFTIDKFKGLNIIGSSNGTIRLQNNKFHIKLAHASIWYDGKNLWTMYNNSDEVNLSEPSDIEIQNLNPYAFIDYYADNFQSTHKTITYLGKTCYELSLRPKSNNIKTKRVLIVVDKKNFQIHSVRIKEENDWIRFRVLDYKNIIVENDSVFSFPKDKYPNIDIIDLR